MWRYSYVQNIEEDGEDSRGQHDAHDGVDHGRGGRLADGFGVAAAAQALITAGYGDEHAVNRAVRHTHPEVVDVEPFLGKCVVFHRIKAEYPGADDEAAHDAHEVGVEHEQRRHGGEGEDAGHDEVVGRGHAERGEGVDFLIDLHGPDDGGIGGPGTARDDDAGHDRAHDAGHAHGPGTHLTDLPETAALNLAMGEAAYHCKVNSTKSMVGHLLGAAGGVEAIACVKAIQENYVHKNAGLVNRDPECDLDCVTEAVETPVNVAMSNSLGFGGHNATLIFKAYEA